MKKHEQKFCTALIKWLKYNIEHTCAIEAKISLDNKPFNFKSGFKPHQLQTLINIKRGSFGFKPSDASMTQQPYDIIYTYEAEAYVAIMWIRKGNKQFYLIDPEEFVDRIKEGHKSMHEGEAHMIATFIGELK